MMSERENVKMAKTEITRRQLPAKVGFILDRLIVARWETGYADPVRTIYNYYVTPDRLNMFVKKIYYEKTGVDARYDFEIAPSAEEETGGMVSVVYLSNKKVDHVIRFTFYDREQKCSLTMGTKLDYIEEEVAYECDDDRCLHVLLADQPEFVTIRDGKRELFRWTPEESSADSLIELLQIPNSNPRKIIERYTRTASNLYQWTDLKGRQLEKFSEVTAPDREAVSQLFDRLKERQSLLGDGQEDAENRDPHEKYGDLWQYAEAINDWRFTIERDVLFQIMRELSPWLYKRALMEKREKECPDPEAAESKAAQNDAFERVNLPNLVFFGAPGTGKSALAERIAKRLLKAKFLKITGGALKAPFEGQTSGEVVKRFIALQKEAGDENTPAVLFIDEAYDLFNNRMEGGSYNGEIITMLLTAMERGKRTLTANVTIGNDSRLMTVTLNENTAVWMAGYEKDMRKALSSNSGMYRRVEPITLPTPVESSLWNTFLQILSGGLCDPAIREENQKLCEDCESVIREYFHWGRSRTYADFFANYSGAIRLAREIEKSSLLYRRSLTTGELTALVEQQKREIRAQYRQVVEEKLGRLPFLVHTDIDETMDKDYIGAEGAVEKLKQVVEMICNPKAYPGCAIPKGALMKGAPGTGKSFLARCMAGSVMKAVKETRGRRKDVAFIKVAGTQLHSAELVKALFSTAEEYDQVIIFIDEIDAIGKRREQLANDGVLIQLLNEMDGFEERGNVFVLAATNVPEALDAALRRAGRFDTEIEIENPGEDSRRELVRRYLHLSHISVSDPLFGELVGELSGQLRGCSPVEIRTILNEAAILYHDCERKLSKKQEAGWKPWFAQRERRGNGPLPGGVRTVCLADGTEVMVLDEGREGAEAFGARANGCKTLFMLDFKEVLARKSAGERQKPDEFSGAFSTERNDGGLSFAAVHEVGHALVSVLYGRTFEKISILTRGGMAGYVEQDPKQRMFTKRDYLEQLDICFGGRAAEELIYGADQISGGASQDIGQASRLARLMVMQLGMNEKVGPVELETSMDGYLGQNAAASAAQSALVMAEDEVRKLLKERYSATVEMLRVHRDMLLKLAKSVFEKEELTGAEFEKLYRDSAGEKREDAGNAGKEI